MHEAVYAGGHEDIVTLLMQAVLKSTRVRTRYLQSFPKVCPLISTCCSWTSWISSGPTARRIQDVTQWYWEDSEVIKNSIRMLITRYWESLFQIIFSRWTTQCPMVLRRYTNGRRGVSMLVERSQIVKLWQTCHECDEDNNNFGNLQATQIHFAGTQKSLGASIIPHHQSELSRVKGIAYVEPSTHHPLDQPTRQQTPITYIKHHLLKNYPADPHPYRNRKHDFRVIVQPSESKNRLAQCTSSETGDDSRLSWIVCFDVICEVARGLLLLLTFCDVQAFEKMWCWR